MHQRGAGPDRVAICSRQAGVWRKRSITTCRYVTNFKDTVILSYTAGGAAPAALAGCTRVRQTTGRGSEASQRRDVA